MKFLFTVPCFLLLLVLFPSRPHVNLHLTEISINDSVPVVHTTDGLVNDWATDMFHPDNDTTVFTAIDNDDNNLYAALTIPEFSMQLKLMRNGMKLFVDLKTKKKTTHGVEFPIGEEVTNFLKSSYTGAKGAGTGQAQQTDKKDFDRKLMRQIMSLGMVSMKILGFPSTQAEQGLKVPGSINIAFKWDANDIMHIEYSMPLKLLNIKAADKPEMDIGWTVNAVQRLQNMNSDENVTNDGDHYRGQGGGGYGGRMNGYGGLRGGSGYNNSSGRSERRMTSSEMMKEQMYWTKYTLVEVKKAF